MYGLNSHVVKERVLRRHYGIATSISWDGSKHPLERRWKDNLDGTWRIDIMKWYAAKVSATPFLSWLTECRDNECETIKKSKSYCSTTLTMMKY